MHVPFFQELKELSENRQEHSEEMTELQEAVEMATLDKEMAEERVLLILGIFRLWKTSCIFVTILMCIIILSLILQLESLQQENEQLKDKLEEVTLDLEILKNEVSEGGKRNFQNLVFETNWDVDVCLCTSSMTAFVLHIERQVFALLHWAMDVFLLWHFVRQQCKFSYKPGGFLRSPRHYLQL